VILHSCLKTFRFDAALKQLKNYIIVVLRNWCRVLLFSLEFKGCQKPNDSSGDASLATLNI